MTKTYKLRGIRDNATDYISTYLPLAVGEIIKWGADEQEEDGIKVWEVVAVL